MKSKTIFNKNNKMKYWVFITLVILLYLLLSLIAYCIYKENIKDIEFIINDKSIGVLELNPDIDIWLPNWTSFWNALQKKSYNFIGYNASLILDILQISIIFFSGNWLVSTLVFDTGDGGGFVNFNDVFWIIFITAFIIYVVAAIAIMANEMKKKGSLSGSEGMARELGGGVVFMIIALLIAPLIFILINSLIFIVFVVFFPFMLELATGNDIYSTESTIGSYTLSTILFNSSFKESMGSFVAVPDADSLFPGDTYHIEISWYLGILPGIPFKHNDFWFTMNSKNQMVVESINFMLFYISEFIVMYYLFKISIKLANNAFELFVLFLTSPIYFATKPTKKNMINDWFRLLIESGGSLIITSSLFLLFSTTFPTLLITLNQNETDFFRNVNWIGIVNIIVIISGLHLTNRWHKKFVKEKQNNIVLLNDNDDEYESKKSREDFN